MGPKALTFIHSLARKTLTKGQGSGITKIPSAMQAEAKASEIFTNLVEAGLKPEMMDDFIRSEADVAKYLNILDAYKRERMKPIPADSPRGKEITEQLFGKRGEVVDMKGNVIPEGSGIMGGESIESLMKSGDVTKGTVTKKSKKVTDRDMFKAADQRLGKPKTDVNTIIKNINSMDPIEAMKEANKVIKREGPYKNLNQQQAKKILEDTEDHIFERNVTPKETDVPMEETADEVTKAYIDAVRKGKFKGTEDQFRDMIDKMMDEDFASGGRVGLRYGGDTMGGINDKSVSSPGPDRSKVSAQQERSHQEAISRARDSQQYDYTVPKQIVKDIAINTGKNLAGQKIASALGIGATPIGILMALKGLYNQTQNPVYSEEDLTYGVPYQTGGRVGLKGGMTRRAFLKLMGGVAAGIGAVKSGIMNAGKKGVTKKVVKEVIKTPNAPGKPEWFDALVNKVILEGDDVTKKLAIKDRQTVHTKKIDNDSEVTVYRDLDDDSVRVEYNSPDVMLDEPVSLTVKPGQADETIKKAPPAEFETYEQGFVARSNGPDDYSIDPEPMIGNSIKDLETDVTKLKEFATGEKQTLKEFVQSKKRKDKVKKINQGDIGETSDYVTKRQGDYYPEYDDYASGGIAGMLGE